MARLDVSSTISIDESELDERFIQAGGPGGQNVNKLATAVQLKFNVAETNSLSPAVKRRLKEIAGRRLSASGILTITAREHRTQQLNREAARERLIAMLREAARPVRHRIKTKPSRAAKRKRLEAKGKRADIKKMRRRPGSE